CDGSDCVGKTVAVTLQVQSIEGNAGYPTAVLWEGKLLDWTLNCGIGDSAFTIDDTYSGADVGVLGTFDASEFVQNMKPGHWHLMATTAGWFPDWEGQVIPGPPVMVNFTFGQEGCAVPSSSDDRG